MIVTSEMFPELDAELHTDQVIGISPTGQELTMSGAQRFMAEVIAVGQEIAQIELGLDPIVSGVGGAALDLYADAFGGDVFDSSRLPITTPASLGRMVLFAELPKLPPRE